MNNRIKEIRTSLNLTMKDFGYRLGVSKSTISNIENGNRNATEHMIKSICREFNVNYRWLTTGEGKMYVDSDQFFYEKIDSILAGENEFHKNLIKYAVNLDIKELETIENMINQFLEMNKKKNNEL